jgi:MFS family permease
MYNRKLNFLASCFGILLFGMGIITLGSIQPDLQERFSGQEFSAGTLFSILPIGILTSSLLFGPICDRYGYKLIFIFSALFLCAGLEGIAFAKDLSLLQTSVFVFGLGGGAINGATNALVSDISEEDKGANLSILGIFYGAGALGMPSLIAVLKNYFSLPGILSFVGMFIFLVALFFTFIRFPQPKNKQGFPLKKSFLLFKNTFLLLVSFFLFFQSSLEGIINNWTTSYLGKELSVGDSSALFALSLFIAGMITMRLLIGSVFRKVNGMKIMFASIALMIVGLGILRFSNSFNIAVAGLVLIGAGLAAGFPIMLGFVGSRFTDLSATAFSFAFVIALLGNSLINYLTGLIVQAYGVQQMISVAAAEVCCMFILCIFIRKHS